MNSTSGSGVLLSGGKQTMVDYVLVESPVGARSSAEGRVLASSDALQAVYAAGPCLLRLQGGGAVNVVLTDCRSDGSSHVQVTGQMKWD